MSVIEITDRQHFQEVLDSSERVVIDFWATWCGPCKMFSPHFHKAAEMASLKSDELGLTNFVAVEVDANPWAMQEFGIQSVPTVALVEQNNVRLIKSRTVVPLLEELRYEA